MIKTEQQKLFFWTFVHSFNKYPLFKSLLQKDFTYIYEDVFFHLFFGNSIQNVIGISLSLCSAS